MASSQKDIPKYCCNPVRKDGVIKEQVALEDLTKRNYNAKWGYMKDFNKICLDIAREKGISEEEYKRRLTRRKGCELPAVSTWELALSGPVPLTTTGDPCRAYSNGLC